MREERWPECVEVLGHVKSAVYSRYCMIITATYLFTVGQGTINPVWWVFIITFLADVAIAGAIGR